VKPTRVCRFIVSNQEPAFSGPRFFTAEHASEFQKLYRRSSWWLGILSSLFYDRNFPTMCFAFWCRFTPVSVTPCVLLTCYNTVCCNLFQLVFVKAWVRSSLSASFLLVKSVMERKRIYSAPSCEAARLLWFNCSAMIGGCPYLNLTTRNTFVRPHMTQNNVRICTLRVHRECSFALFTRATLC